MQRPAYWLLADPALNRQFSRGWIEPPWTQNRTRHPGRGGDVIGNQRNGNPGNLPDLTAAAQAREAAEALFRQVGS